MDERRLFTFVVFGSAIGCIPPERDPSTVARDGAAMTADVMDEDAGDRPDVPPTIDAAVSIVDASSIDVRPVDVGSTALRDVVAEMPPVPPFADLQPWPEPSNPDTLRPRWPRTNAHVGSRRPLLRWVRPAGVTSVDVVMCRDRALTRDCISFTSTEPEGRPTSDLAPGRWFWQPRAASLRGAVWTIRVPTATIHDRAWGGDFDFNGDGIGDVPPVIFVGRILVWLSTPAGPSQTPTEIGPMSPVSEVARDVGDVDADGYSDIVVVPAGFSRTPMVVSVFRGSPSGPLPTAFVGIEPWRLSSGTTRRVGDLDADGFDDLAFQTYWGHYLLHGGPEGLRGMLTTEWDQNYESDEDVTGDGTPDYFKDGATPLGLRVDPAVAPGLPGRLTVVPISDDRITRPRVGDIDGDGVADVLRGSTPQVIERGGPERGRTTTLARGSGFSFSTVFTVGGDFDGNGLDDVIETNWSYGRLYSVLSATIAEFVPLREGFGTTGYRWIETGGDLDGDGTSDLIRLTTEDGGLVIALSDERGPSIQQRGGTYYEHGMTQPRDTRATWLTKPAVVGDLDGDGASEVVYPSHYGSSDVFCLWVVEGRMGRMGRMLPSWCGGNSSIGQAFAAGNITGAETNEALLRIDNAYQLVGGGRASGQTIASPRADAPALFPAGDVNGDGIADLVAVGSGSGSVLFGVRGGLPREGGRFTFSAGTGSGDLEVLVAGDVDMDGFGDFVVRGSFAVLLAGSAAGVRNTPLLADPSHRAATPVGDVDGDGIADLIVRTEADLRFFRGGRGGLREVESARRTGPFDTVVAVGDVTGDHHADFCADHLFVEGSAAGPDYGHALAWPVGGRACVATNDARGGGDWDGDGVSDIITWDGFRSLVPPYRRPPLELRLR